MIPMAPANPDGVLRGHFPFPFSRFPLPLPASRFPIPEPDPLSPFPTGKGEPDLGYPCHAERSEAAEAMPLPAILSPATQPRGLYSPLRTCAEDCRFHFSGGEANSGDLASCQRYRARSSLNTASAGRVRPALAASSPAIIRSGLTRARLRLRALACPFRYSPGFCSREANSP